MRKPIAVSLSVIFASLLMMNARALQPLSSVYDDNADDDMAYSPSESEKLLESGLTVVPSIQEQNQQIAHDLLIRKKFLVDNILAESGLLKLRSLESDKKYLIKSEKYSLNAPVLFKSRSKSLQPKLALNTGKLIVSIPQLIEIQKEVPTVTTFKYEANFIPGQQYTLQTPQLMPARSKLSLSSLELNQHMSLAIPHMQFVLHKTVTKIAPTNKVVNKSSYAMQYRSIGERYQLLKTTTENVQLPSFIQLKSLMVGLTSNADTYFITDKWMLAFFRDIPQKKIAIVDLRKSTAQCKATFTFVDMFNSYRLNQYQHTVCLQNHSIVALQPSTNIEESLS